MTEYEEGVKACCIAAKLWMATLVTTRCNIITEIGKALEAKLKPLSELVAHEVGKPLSKAIGKVKEVIDACNSAVQYSKQSQLVVSHSSNHVAYEEWRPYGVIAVITPFYLQCAALGQNAWLALVIGNCVIWRGPVESPSVTIAITKLIAGVLEKNNLTGSIFTSFAGGSELNKAIAKDTRIPLVSFKGNSQVGKVVKHIVVERFGKCLLESDRKDAITVLSDADIQLAVEAIVRDTVGTADQGLSTCHRLFLHESIYGDVLDRLRQRYGSITIGNPLETGTELGLLFSHATKKHFLQLIDAIKSQGGKILTGGSDTKYARNFVQPTIVEISTSAKIVKGGWVFPVILVFKYQSW